MNRRAAGGRANWPYMTLILTLLCLLMRGFYGVLGDLQRRVVVESAGANPAELAAALSDPAVAWTALGWPRLALSLFIHSSWLHLVGNLAYLWVFGIPVERRLGAFNLLLIFVLGGVLAHMIVAVQMPQLFTPVIGASGAVSAVVGAYLALFPRRQIGLYLPLGLFVQFTRLSSLLVIGSWFTLQLVYSALAPISAAMAWWTHLAGFVLGLIFALLVRALAQLKPGY